MHKLSKADVKFSELIGVLRDVAYIILDMAIKTGKIA